MLGDRLPDMSPADVASMASAMRRVGIDPDDWLLVAARRRLAETQRTDGGWAERRRRRLRRAHHAAAIRACR